MSVRREEPRRGERGREADVERSLRGLIGAGSSQVGVSGALRARDAARPTAEDLAAAEQAVSVVRRHYVPPSTGPLTGPLTGPVPDRGGNARAGSPPAT